MPTLTIYLDKELYEFVKENPSKIIQRVLKENKQIIEESK